MTWQDVGEWLRDNAGHGATLVGSLLTGNVPAAVAAGTAMVATATGTDDPRDALAALQADPTTVARLREIAAENEADVRRHLEVMERMRLEDRQVAHHETQETIRAGDRATDGFVRRTRPGMAWASLLAAMVYALTNAAPDVLILGALLTLPLAYAGLRGVDKGFASLLELRRGR